MLNFVDIALPSEAADGYYMNNQKELVDQFIYIPQEWYNRLWEPTTFYILGAKGSGKTLMAAYMCSQIRNKTVSQSYTIDVGDYGKLIAMKQEQHLKYTDYLTMWKVILLQKFLFSIKPDEIQIWNRAKKFDDIQDTISHYFGYDVTQDSFNPVSVIDSCEKQIEVVDYLLGEISDTITVSPINVHARIEAKSEDRLKHALGNKMDRSAMIYTDTWMRSIN